MVVEKACAKAHGTYEALPGKNIDYWLQCFTGSMISTIVLTAMTSASSKLTFMIERGLRAYASAQRKTKSGSAVHMWSCIHKSQEEIKEMGKWHGSSVMAQMCPNVPYAIMGMKGHMLTLAAPFAGDKWVPPGTNSSTNTFDMNIEEWVNLFDMLYVAVAPSKHWETQKVKGCWNASSSGGCCNDQTWVQNSQFRLTVGTEADQADCTEVVTALTHLSLCQPAASKNSIGFVVYKSKQPKTMPAAVASTVYSHFHEHHEVNITLELELGATYHVVPSTFMPGEDGNFVLAAYSEMPVNMVLSTQLPKKSKKHFHEGVVDLCKERQYAIPEIAIEYADLLLRAVAMPHGFHVGEVLAMRAAKNSSMPKARHMGIISSAAEVMYNDVMFPPSGSSLYKDPQWPPGSCPKAIDVKWMRLSARGVSTFKGHTLGKIQPGYLSNGWMLQALTIVSQSSTSIEPLIGSELYKASGLYVIRLFFKGSWRNVMIDDYIPFRDRAAEHPLFAHCEDPKEAWPMLLEKACAKLYGSYEALCSGTLEEGLLLFTGGIVTSTPSGGNIHPIWRQTHKMLGHGLHVNVAAVYKASSIDMIGTDIGHGIKAETVYQIREVQNVHDDKNSESQLLFRLEEGIVPGEHLALCLEDAHWIGQFSKDWWKNKRNESAGWSHVKSMVDRDPECFWMRHMDMQQHFTHVYAAAQLPPDWHTLSMIGSWGTTCCFRVSYPSHAVMMLHGAGRSKVALLLVDPDGNVLARSQDQPHGGIGAALIPSQELQPYTDYIIAPVWHSTKTPTDGYTVVVASDADMLITDQIVTDKISALGHTVLNRVQAETQADFEPSDDLDWFHKYQVIEGRTQLQDQEQRRKEAVASTAKSGVSSMDGLLHLITDIEEEGLINAEILKMRKEITQCQKQSRTLFGRVLKQPRDLFDAMESHGDGDGLVGYNEFVNGFERLKFPTVDGSRISAVFNHIDVDGSGGMSFEEFNDVLGDGDGSSLEARRDEKQEKERKARTAKKEKAAKKQKRQEAGAWHVMAMRRLFDPVESCALLNCRMLGKLMRRHLHLDEALAHTGVCVPYMEFSAAVIKIDSAMSSKEVGAMVTCIGAEPGTEIDLDLFLDVIVAYQTYRTAVQRIVHAFAGNHPACVFPESKENAL